MFKELCLLHLRDLAARTDAPLIEILNDPVTPLTWRQLQRILGEEIRGEMVASMEEKGRLSADRRAFAHSALQFLRARDPVFCTGLHDSIYHLVWSRVHGPETYVRPPDGLYRGHADFRWRLESTLVRPDAEGLRVGVLSSRMRATMYFVRELRKRQSEFFGRTPTDEELVAVAQHYGFPTGMLDFTRSLHIAAFFATMHAHKAKDGDVGAIFELTLPNSAKSVQELRESPSFGGFDLLRAASIHLGKLRLIEPPLADGDNRIARQQGVFVTDFHPRDFQHALSSPMLFRQVPGEVFEDPLANIHRTHLLQDDTPLATFAEEVRTAFERKNHETVESALPLSGVENVVLPDMGIIGANGGALQAVLTDGHGFLSRLRSFVQEFNDEEYITGSLAEVLDEYFALARIRADVGQNAGENVHPFHEAIAKLAALAQVEETLLWSVAKPHLTSELGRDASISSLPVWEPSTIVERLAASIALYLAAWERLQFIDGDAIRDTAERAMDHLITRRITKIFGRSASRR
jgi:hypothetical protein